MAYIDDQLQQLSPEKRVLVYAFVTFLVQQEREQNLEQMAESRQMMFAAKAVLRRDWDSPEEAAAWAHL